MSDELIPCPLCNQEVVINALHPDENSIEVVQYFIEHKNDEDNVLCVMSASCGSKEYLIASWNNRPREEASQKSVAELEKALELSLEGSKAILQEFDGMTEELKTLTRAVNIHVTRLENHFDEMQHRKEK